MSMSIMVTRLELSGRMDLVIMCYKCQKPVETITVETNPVTDKKKFTVICHGEREITELSPSDVLEAHVTGGIAFKRPRLSGELYDGL